MITSHVPLRSSCLLDQFVHNLQEKCPFFVIWDAVEAFLMCLNRKYICDKYVKCSAEVHISNRAICNKQFQSCVHLLLGPTIKDGGGKSEKPIRRGQGHAAWIKGTFLKLSGDLAWSLWIVFQAALLKEFPNKMLVTVIQCVFSTVQALVVAAVAERDITRWKLRPDISLLAIIYTGFVVSGLSYFLQVWCMEMKGPVFFAVWMPLGFIFTMFCSSFFLGEIIHLGSILGGILLIGGLYSVLWAKSKETTIEPACSVESAQDSKEHMKPVGNQEKEQGRARGGNISI
ncbi:hypothetical protein SETIT_2G115800v2 [Setaria italica]|uniref:WAT1-related protein n=1 Tax=Setaria italica TaxID=4555 RepID=A0A368PY77_SETIT|nr:hypothetical protein SETIT_2G115800v2 [Setaria italica]